MISIHRERVAQLADSIKTLPIAPNLNEQLAPPINADQETTLRAFLYAAAICHATKGGFKGEFDGIPYKGWDYLYHAFRKLAEKRPNDLDPQMMKEATAQLLHNHLERFATNAEIQLADLDRRAEILRQLAAELIQIFNGQATDILTASDRMAGGDKGAYAQLARLHAFQDPLQKKSSVFLMLAEASGMMTVEDQENLFPMIDYHLIRILLRLGCIEIDDEELRSALFEKKQIEPAIEREIREHVKSVCTLLVEQTHLPLIRVDNLLWSHARSYCRHTPVCQSGNQPENPSFDAFTNTAFDGACPFQSWCPGAHDIRYRDLWEPITETEYY